MDQALMAGLFRHVLQVIAGMLMARGYISESMVDGVVGGASSLLLAGWYAYGKIKAGRAS